MVSQLTPGVKVMTTAGLLGTVREVGDEIGLEVAPGVVVRFVPPAIARVIPAGVGTEGPSGAPQLEAEAAAEQLQAVADPTDAIGPEPVAPSQSGSHSQSRPQS
jgi:hypothetical protein